MASAPEQVEQDASIMALTNQVILRAIFSYLPFEDLKTCRLVNRVWNFEAGSYIRDFHHCHARISEAKPGFDLQALNDLVSKMSIVPINGLTINQAARGHSVCKPSQTESNIYGELLDKMSLRYLDIDCDLSSLKCPEIPLREKLPELHTLKVCPQKLLDYLGNDWTPWLPKLRVLDIAGLVSSTKKDFVLKIINGAPNLVKLKGHFLPEVLDYIPEEKYMLLDMLVLYIDSDEVEEKCAKLAKARPALSELWSYGFNSQYKDSFFRVMAELLGSSCQTVEKFRMVNWVFPLTQLKFPPLVNLTVLVISTELSTSEILNILRYVEYPKLLPALCEVEICQGWLSENFAGAEDCRNAQDYYAASLTPNHCVTVKKLNMEVVSLETTVQELSSTYPNVADLVVLQQLMNYFTAIPYLDFWTHWPHLESIYINEGDDALRGNFDADFLGIHPKELKLLRDVDDESLEKMNIVPIRPCILTMLHIRSVRIRFDKRPAFRGYRRPHRVFLSKVTGILAFKKLAKTGVTIELLSPYPETVSCLEHLVPFATVMSCGELF